MDTSVVATSESRPALRMRSLAEKRAIVAETRVPGASVAAVERRPRGERQPAVRLAPFAAARAARSAHEDAEREVAAGDFDRLMSDSDIKPINSL
jgi:hypothetical protein